MGFLTLRSFCLPSTGISKKAAFEQLAWIGGMGNACFKVGLCQLIHKNAVLHHQHAIAHMGDDR